MEPETIIMDTRDTNWYKSTQALKYLQPVFVPIVKDKMKSLQLESLTDFGRQLCAEATSDDIIQANDNMAEFKHMCPGTVDACQKLLNIIKGHTSDSVRFYQMLKGTDPQQWLKSPFEFVRLFLEDWMRCDIHDFQECDITALCTIVKRCKPLMEIFDKGKLDSLRKVRNRTMHPATMSISQEEMENNIDVILDFLEHMKSLKSTDEVTEATESIKQLRTGDVRLLHYMVVRLIQGWLPGARIAYEHKCDQANNQLQDIIYMENKLARLSFGPDTSPKNQSEGHEFEAKKEEKRELETQNEELSKRLKEEKRELEKQNEELIRRLEEEKRELEKQNVELSKRLEEEKRELEKQNVELSKRLEEEKRELEKQNVELSKRLKYEKRKSEKLNEELSKRLEEEKRELEKQNVELSKRLEEEKRELEKQNVELSKRLETKEGRNFGEMRLPKETSAQRSPDDELEFEEFPKRSASGGCFPIHVLSASTSSGDKGKTVQKRRVLWSWLSDYLPFSARKRSGDEQKTVKEERSKSEPLYDYPRKTLSDLETLGDEHETVKEELSKQVSPYGNLRKTVSLPEMIGYRPKRSMEVRPKKIDSKPLPTPTPSPIMELSYSSRLGNRPIRIMEVRPTKIHSKPLPTPTPSPIMELSYPSILGDEHETVKEELSKQGSPYGILRRTVSLPDMLGYRLIKRMEDLSKQEPPSDCPKMTLSDSETLDRNTLRQPTGAEGSFHQNRMTSRVSPDPE